MILDVPAAPMCATCGKCCRRMPGQFLPDDLGQTVEERQDKALQLLKSGDYSIDWYEGDPRLFSQKLGDDLRDRVYYLRPSTKRAHGIIFDPSWGGECVLLGSNGCTLKREDRPTICKALVPSEKGCNGMSKQECALLWLDDSEWLGQLGEELA